LYFCIFVFCIFERILIHISLILSNQTKTFCSFENKRGSFDCLSRTLSLGDFVWALKSDRNQESDPDFVIHSIFERKTLSDLWHSVLDGRFKEQLLRLKQTNLQIFYILEGNETSRTTKIDPKVYCGVLNELWLRGVYVHTTSDASETIRYLERMASVIDSIIRSEGVQAYPFAEYQQKFQHTKKTATVGATWARMLLQIPGLGVRKAMAITTEYPTPSTLIDTYRQVNETEGQRLLEDLKSQMNASRVGLKSSGDVFTLCTSKNYDKT
jgi:ERCC4-type nuclease